ncbi:MULTISPECIES: DUF6525 family protein [unclassified Ruegeria]|uniref:DUF6525 family protein n=1 Tax=unclassified Ruegeria TaxID=2625375 RepID=UPI00211067E5|nr:MULTISPECIES: DUF6525 family protein [unclassified Ruegeria]
MFFHSVSSLKDASQVRLNQPRNLRSGLRPRKRQGCPMQAYDALPSELREWLANACLPWSPSSALKIWKNEGGAQNPQAAMEKLSAVEQAMLARDQSVWQIGPTRGSAN